MKKLKCVASVVLGGLLGLIASCARPARKPEAAPPAAKTPTNETSATQAPAKGEDMPVRRPILE